MRLHALHVQGLDAPRGTQRVPFRSGYTLVVGERPSLLGLQKVLLGLLYPERALEDLVGCGEPGGSNGPRAVLRVQVGSEVYQVGADLQGRRLALARFDPAANRFARITTDPMEAGQKLRELGRPDREIFGALGLLGFEDRVGPETVSHPAPEDATPIAPVEAAPPVPGGASSEGGGSAPLGHLATEESSPESGQGTQGSEEPESPQERVLELEREEKHLEAELRKYSVLVEADEDLELRIEQYRALREDCTRQLTALDQTRQSLLGERIKLQRVPSVRAPWIWAGMAFALLGGIAAVVTEPWVGLLGLLGLAIAGVAYASGRRAHRRLGRLEARIAALRVRERTLERRFEESAAPVRTPLVALELEGVDELADALRLMRNVGTRLEAVRRELEDARRALKERPPLGPTESSCTAGLAAPGPEAPSPLRSVRTAHAAPPRSTDRPPAGPRGPEALLDSAAHWSGRSTAELWTEIQACLPLYLRAISQGHLREMVALGADIWGIVREDRGAAPIHVLPLPDQRHVEVAVHLALRERLASGGRLPLVVGPGAEGLEGHPAGLGRALGRLARVVQIVQLSESSEPWDAHAAQVYRLG